MPHPHHQALPPAFQELQRPLLPCPASRLCVITQCWLWYSLEMRFVLPGLRSHKGSCLGAALSLKHELGFEIQAPPLSTQISTPEAATRPINLGQRQRRELEAHIQDGLSLGQVCVNLLHPQHEASALPSRRTPK